jgi:hypothetical protein
MCDYDHIMKGSQIPTLIATCALAFNASDSSASEPEADKGWREIDSGTHSAIEEASQVVIQDATVWDVWWRKHTKNMFDSEQPDGIKPPEVDFEKETVIVATLGMRSTGGHSVRFVGVNKEGESLTVTLQSTSPGPDDMVTMALTYPFAIIAVPKHEGEVVFVMK